METVLLLSADYWLLSYTVDSHTLLPSTQVLFSMQHGAKHIWQASLFANIQSGSSETWLCQPWPKSCSYSSLYSLLLRLSQCCVLTSQQIIIFYQVIYCHLRHFTCKMEQNTFDKQESSLYWLYHVALINDFLFAHPLIMFYINVLHCSQCWTGGLATWCSSLACTEFIVNNRVDFFFW